MKIDIFRIYKSLLKIRLVPTHQNRHYKIKTFDDRTNFEIKAKQNKYSTR